MVPLLEEKVLGLYLLLDRVLDGSRPVVAVDRSTVFEFHSRRRRSVLLVVAHQNDVSFDARGSARRVDGALAL